jgi:hypothetical protein
MLKPEGFFSFVWGMTGVSRGPGDGANGTCFGTGVDAGAVERPLLPSDCFFLLTPTSPLWGHERTYWVWRCAPRARPLVPGISVANYRAEGSFTLYG